MPDRTVAPPFVKSASFDLIKPEVEDLPNGVRTFFISGSSQDVLKIEFVFAAGRWFENKTAAAHFTGQLLSAGTADRTSFEIASIFDQYGAHLEVIPGLDFVSVSLYALRKNLDTVLGILMEIITRPAFPEKEFEQIRSVFIQNLRVNNEKTSFVASQTFRKNIFGNQHPYGVVIKEEHPGKLQTTDFSKHFQTYYTRPVVFVSGKITPADREQMLNRFTQYPAGTTPTGKAHSVQEGPKHEHIERPDSVQSSIRMGKRSVLRSHEDYASILFVSHILGGYFGSRLMKNIREEKGLTYGISASIHGMKHDSYLIIGADVNKENTGVAFDEIRKELKTLRTTRISPDELETSRNHFIGSLQSEITTAFAHADKIKTIELHNLSPDHYRNLISKIDTITPEKIAETSERYYHEDSFIQVAVG